jgi:ornithine decarboxylase
MAEEAGYAFSLLDVGGAFKDFPFGQAATYLNNGVDRYFPDWRCTKIIAEPGRFYVPKAFRLAANINAPLAMPVREISDQPAGMCASFPLHCSFLGCACLCPFQRFSLSIPRLHQRWDVWRFQPYLVRSPQPNILSMNGSFASSEPAHLSCALPATPSTLLARRPFPVALQIGDWLG